MSTFTETYCGISDPDPVSNTILLIPLCNHNTLRSAKIWIFLEVYIPSQVSDDTKNKK